MKNFELTKYIKKIIKNTIFENNVFYVGGMIRSYLLNEPFNDVDMCISLKNGGILFSNWLYENNYLNHEPVVYPTYGTAMCIFKDFPDIEIECVQTRKEQYKNKNSRNPKCVYGSLEDDIYRRDFTCNTLLYDISKQQILDLTCKGIEDIKNKIIRSPRELIL